MLSRRSSDELPKFETRFYWPHDCFKRDARRYLFFKSFVQFMVNRLAQGCPQYGPASATQRYHERAQYAIKAYRKTGNQEYLIDAANYMFLEMQAPSVNGAHFDNNAESATRGKFGRGGWIPEVLK